MNMILLLLALAQEGFTPLGEGVIDDRGTTIYLSGAAGKVEALDAASGRVKWTSEASGRVVATSGGKVAVEAGSGNHLKILLLEVGTGALLWTSAKVELPEWVSTSPQAGRRFEAWATLGRGFLLYDWKAEAGYAGGAPPPAEVEKAARKSASGRVSIDLAALTTSAGPIPPEALQVRHAPPNEVKVGLRTYKVVRDPDRFQPGVGDQQVRRLTCVSSDPAEPGWSHPLRRILLPALPPSAPGGRP